TRKPPPAPPPPNGPGGHALKDMVAAVSTSKTGPAVEVKFYLLQRPEVGQPLDVDVAIVPGPALEGLSADFQGADGLDLVGGGQLARVDKPAEGAPLAHTVKVVPKRLGVFAVTVVVSTYASNQSSTRSFSIPVIAGEGVPGLAAKPESSKGL